MCRTFMTQTGFSAKRIHRSTKEKRCLKDYMHPEEGTTADNVYYTADTVQAVNRNGNILMTFPATATTLTTSADTNLRWTIEGTGYPKAYEVGWATSVPNNTLTFTKIHDTEKYIFIPDELQKTLKGLNYNLNNLSDLFAEFCQRLIDLHEDMRLDEAFHDSEDLDDFLKEFIVNNKKN